MRSGDIGSPDVALACELNILFKVGDKKVHKQASAQIVKDLGNNKYLALTARTNLFLITKESVQINAEEGLVFVQRKSKKEYLAKFKFNGEEDIFHYDNDFLKDLKSAHLDGLNLSAIVLTPKKLKGEMPIVPELSVVDHVAL